MSKSCRASSSEISENFRTGTGVIDSTRNSTITSPFVPQKQLHPELGTVLPTWCVTAMLTCASAARSVFFTISRYSSFSFLSGKSFLATIPLLRFIALTTCCFALLFFCGAISFKKLELICDFGKELICDFGTGLNREIQKLGTDSFMDLFRITQRTKRLTSGFPVLPFFEFLNFWIFECLNFFYIERLIYGFTYIERLIYGFTYLERIIYGFPYIQCLIYGLLYIERLIYGFAFSLQPHPYIHALIYGFLLSTNESVPHLWISFFRPLQQSLFFQFTISLLRCF